jgi:hypothetical protein
MAPKKRKGKKNKNATPEDVAAWMAKRVRADGELDQETAVLRIRKKFGDRFVTLTSAGGYSIDKPVRQAFNKLMPGVVWDISQWRWRLPITGDDVNSEDVAQLDGRRSSTG